MKSIPTIFHGDILKLRVGDSIYFGECADYSDNPFPNIRYGDVRDFFIPKFGRIISVHIHNIFPASQNEIFLYRLENQ